MIHWDKDGVHGTADLESIRRLYRNGHSKPADGLPMPLEPAPRHIHQVGSDCIPIAITSIDYENKIVRLQKIPVELAKALLGSNFKTTQDRGKILVPAVT